MMAEAGQKNERRSTAAAALNEWHQQREGQIQLRKQNNESMESQYQTRVDEERKGNNPWDRVTGNCDLSMAGVTAGGHDKTRMKQAMLNRKADIAAGEPVIGSFATNRE